MVPACHCPLLVDLVTVEGYTIQVVVTGGVVAHVEVAADDGFGEDLEQSSTSEVQLATVLI